MSPFMKTLRRQTGVSIIEVMVTLVILLFGLMGLAGMMAQSQRSELESYQRVQALVLLQDMAGRISSNSRVAGCYVTTVSTAASPYMGTNSTVTPACTTGTAEQNARAIQDLNDWNSLLLGAAEKISSNNVGTMLGARGCVSSLAVANTYLITVTWQGVGATFAPAGLKCGEFLYDTGGADTQRRAVSLTLQVAVLNP
jgi:type IV pilus assembly protein PilV